MTLRACCWLTQPLQDCPPPPVTEGAACFEQGEEGRACVLPALRLLTASPEASLQINPGCLDPTKVQKGSSSPEQPPELGEA